MRRRPRAATVLETAAPSHRSPRRRRRPGRRGPRRHRPAAAEHPSRHPRASRRPSPVTGRVASAGMTLLDAIAAVAAVAVLAALFVAEARAPLRRRVRPRAERLAVNAVVAIAAALVVRLAVVPVGLAVAGATERGGVGVLHWLAAPTAIAWTAGLLLLDYTMYLWHRLNHRVPVLWRFHLVHHTDL